MAITVEGSLPQLAALRAALQDWANAHEQSCPLTIGIRIQPQEPKPFVQAWLAPQSVAQAAERLPSPLRSRELDYRIYGPVFPEQGV